VSKTTSEEAANMRAGLSFGGMSSASEPILSSSEESADEFDTSDDSSSEDNERVSSTTRPTPRAPRKADDDSDVDKKFKFPTHTDVFAYDEALKKLKEITSVTGRMPGHGQSAVSALEVE
jgi:hypothetical protein